MTGSEMERAIINVCMKYEMIEEDRETRHNSKNKY